MLCFGHDKDTAHMNLEQLWFPAQELHEIKPVKILRGVEE